LSAQGVVSRSADTSPFKEMTLAAPSEETGKIWAEHTTMEHTSSAEHTNSVPTALSSPTMYARLAQELIKKKIGLADAIL
jgi:hypothetical protein